MISSKQQKWFFSFFLLIVIGTWLNFCYADNHPKTIRVAILDNPNMPAKLWTWLQYEKAYLQGIETAKAVGNKKGVNIIYKSFFYGTDPLDVLNEVPKVKAWHPDVILGPHYSNQFLLLKNQFSNVLVLTPYASDKAISNLPNNFYSLFPPDEITVKAMADFINKKFPNHNVLVINRIDCKACNDISVLFHQMYQKINPKIKIKQSDFLGESDNITNLGKLLSEYQKGDVIVVLAVNLYNYTDLIIKISSSLKNQTPIFISLVDNWGKSGSGLPISNKINLHFQAYLVNPLLSDQKSKNFKEFYKNYYSLYGKSPDENVSYMTYMAMMSVMTALNNFSTKNKNIDIRDEIIYSYRNALKKNANWFRPNTYAIYQMDAQSGKTVDVMNMISYMNK